MSEQAQRPRRTGFWTRRGPRIAAGVLAALVLLALAASGAAYVWVYRSASIPSPDELRTPEPTVILDRNGEEVATLEPASLRRNVSLEDLPDHVPAAVLAAEDRRFREHGGYSMRDIARAAWANLTAGEVQQGASTIHQQYVSLAVAEVGSGYAGKFREAVLAARLDDELDKDTVLQMYLNAVPFGRSARGIEAAARTYFGVPARELDVEQAALLAGMIAAPTAYDPADNPEGAAARRDFVVDAMAEQGRLEPSRARELIGSELPDLREEPLVQYGDDAFFVQTVRNRVPELLDEETRDPSRGLVVHTTLAPGAQRLAAEEARSALDAYPYQAAVTTVESRTGAVRALIGGLDFAEQQYNVAFSGRAQPGSSFKPLALTELVAQGYDPDRTRIHAPAEYEVEQRGSEDHTVHNYTNRSHGEISAREATVDSVNTAYVQLAEELGPESIADTASSMGVDSELAPVPVLPLGTSAVPPIEMTTAYATLAAEGTRHEPYVIERIEDRDGATLHEHERDPQEVLDPEVAAVVTDVLVDVVERGTGTAANLSRPNAGKTGTTNEYSDAWFVGYTPDYTTAVWVGHAGSNQPMEDRISGGSLPAQIWGDYMGSLLEDREVREFPEPETQDLRALTGLERPEPEPSWDGDGDAESDRESDEDGGRDDRESDGDSDDGEGDGNGDDGEGDGDGNNDSGDGDDSGSGDDGGSDDGSDTTDSGGDGSGSDDGSDTSDGGGDGSGSDDGSDTTSEDTGDVSLDDGGSTEDGSGSDTTSDG